MRGVKQFFGWLVTVLLLASFMVSGAFATPIKPIMAHIEGIEPVKIGEKTFIPVQIDRLDFKLKSAKIWFETNTNFVKIDDTIVDVGKLTSFPSTVYVPIAVIKEGLFDFEGILHIEALDGETIFDKEYFDYPLYSLGIFAFEGEVFFGRSDISAMEAAAANSLKKTNSEYNKLLNKKESIDKGTLRESFSEEENEKLRQLKNKAYKDLYERYFEKYPIKTESASILFNTAPSSKPQKGETVNLEVNWLIDSTCTSFCTYIVV
jgi:hypothetical protein